MSYTTAYRLSRARFVVAIAGSTGNLGQAISHVLIDSGHRAFFNRVICLVRSLSAASEDLEKLGAEVVVVDYESADSLREALQGVDALINALGGVSLEIKNRLASVALKDCNIPLYFPSEFGVDHRLNNFPGYDHHEWIEKRDHDAFVRTLVDQLQGDTLPEETQLDKARQKVVAVYNGLFLQDSLSVFFDTRLSCPSHRVALTSKSDIGRTLFELIILWFTSPDKVPDHVKIAGCVPSCQELQTAGYIGPHDTHVSLDEYLEELKQKYTSGEWKYPRNHIRALIAQNLLDFSTQNQNDLVNPGQRLWKWQGLDNLSAVP